MAEPDTLIKEFGLFGFRPAADRKKFGEELLRSRRKHAVPRFIADPADVCDYRKLTTRFKHTINLPKEMFDKDNDYCFCPTCHNGRGDTDYYYRGNPPSIYVLPQGWRRFGIKITVPKGTSSDRIWKTWHVAFHGTEFRSVESIWRVGLRIPGEPTWDGREVVQLAGHFNEDEKPEGFDTLQIFVSPSVRYSGGDTYAPTKKYFDPVTKKEYKCRITFQLRVNPKSYTVGPKTVSRKNIDPYIKDNVLEWATKDKNALMLTGLLINMVEC